MFSRAAFFVNRVLLLKVIGKVIDTCWQRLRRKSGRRALAAESVGQVADQFDKLFAALAEIVELVAAGASGRE